jgi:tryptophanase
MFIEVDSEKNELPLHENAARQMRLKFYRKLGAKTITDRYLIPHYDGSESEEMYLMIKPAIERRFFKRQQLMEYVGAIHKRVYRHGKDLVDRMKLALPKTIQLS